MRRALSLLLMLSCPLWADAPPAPPPPAGNPSGAPLAAPTDGASDPGGVDRKFDENLNKMFDALSAAQDKSKLSFAMLKGQCDRIGTCGGLIGDLTRAWNSFDKLASGSVVSQGVINKSWWSVESNRTNIVSQLNDLNNLLGEGNRRLGADSGMCFMPDLQFKRQLPCSLCKPPKPEPKQDKGLFP